MFVEVKSNRVKNKLVLGVGVNDADYLTSSKIKGKVYECPFYRRWSAMLGRCYSKSYQKNQMSYVGCTVCNEWLTFSSFKSWMIKQDWKGRHLDKDILTQGNKIYSPEFCLFVSSKVNTIFSNRAASRGDYPLGVSMHHGTGKYHAKCSTTHLGLFDNALLAHKAYKVAKYKMIADLANRQPEPLKTAMLNYII